MEFIFKYFWAIALVVAIANTFVLKRQIRQRIEQDPELESGYYTLIKGFTLFSILPWLVIGIGILTGKVENMFQYFIRPDFSNEAVIAFWVTIAGLVILCGFWIFFNGGAEMLERHPGFIRFYYFGKHYDRLTSNQVKLTWLGAVIIFAVMLYLFWSNNFPLPPTE